MRKIILLLTLLPFLAFAKTNTVVYNVTNKQVVSGSLDQQEVSIASISKLMTVYTVLSQGQDLDEKLKVTARKTSNTKLSKGMVLTRRDLIDLALVSSDNIAAITLGENFPGGMNYFVYTMNQHANELHLSHTGFVEPTGLSPMNYSSISDLVILTQEVSKFNIVQNAAKTQREFKTSVEGTKVIKKVKHKNKVVREGSKTITAHPTSSYFGRTGIITIKTGFTRAAGFCITMLVYADNQLYNITVLGARTKQERQKLVEKSLKSINA
jgi:D-alanyl-D-alanine endopeptidase (penicillin-binding protein 7)